MKRFVSALFLKASTPSSKIFEALETSLRLTPVAPIDSISFSTFRVETPSRYASEMTLTKAFSQRLLGFKQGRQCVAQKIATILLNELAQCGLWF